MIDLNEFAKEVHANAVAHGWYDGGERTEAEIFANIHSEWSEAFDAYAHGLPWYYHHCGDPATKDRICEDFEDCYSRKIGWDGDHCFMRNKKPEGIAVELIDGVIRILDYLEHYNSKHNQKIAIKTPDAEAGDWDICKTICMLHDDTVEARHYARGTADAELITAYLGSIIEIVFMTIEKGVSTPKKSCLKSMNITRRGRIGMAGRWSEMIIKEIKYIAICNRCARRRVETEADNMTELREILRGTGWSVGGRTLCTECKNMMRRERYAKNR